MKKPQDAVWDTITNSAKTRFDYAKFERAFSDFHNDNIAENVLFLTVAGHAVGDSSERIVEGINLKLLVFEVSIEAEVLMNFISARKSDLFREIKATETALALFDMGLQAPGVLVQTQSILANP